jgi:hypothetical protein
MDVWTPIAYYYGQVTSVGCLYRTGTLANPQRFNIWAVGGLVGYDFGPAQLSVWATQEVSAKAFNPAAVAATGADLSLVPQGMTVLATLSYRLWGPENTAEPSNSKSLAVRTFFRQRRKCRWESAFFYGTVPGVDAGGIDRKVAKTARCLVASSDPTESALQLSSMPRSIV